MKRGFSRLANNYADEDDAKSIDTQSEHQTKSQNSTTSKNKNELNNSLQEENRN